MKKKVSAANISLCVLAMLFFKYGFWQLSYLTNISMANTLKANETPGPPQFTAVEITSFAVTTVLAQPVGFFLAAVFSFILSARKRIDLFESFVAFVLFWALSGMHLTNGKYFNMVACIPGSGLRDYRFFLVNGALLTFIGILLLLVKRKIALKFKDWGMRPYPSNS